MKFPCRIFDDPLAQSSKENQCVLGCRNRAFRKIHSGHFNGFGFLQLDSTSMLGHRESSRPEDFPVGIKGTPADVAASWHRTGDGTQQGRHGSQ